MKKRVLLIKNMQILLIKKCAEIASIINLQKYMFLGQIIKKMNQKNEKISGDCLEALIGAIFLDGRI